MPRYNKRIIMIIFIIMLSLTGIGCSNKNSETYPSLLKFEDAIYTGTKRVPTDSYPSKKLLGTITKRIAPDQKPKEDFESNSLDMGTEIYFLEEQFIGAKVDHELLIFEISSTLNK